MRSFGLSAAARSVVRAGCRRVHRSVAGFVGRAALIVSSPAHAASITGTVTGPDGAPLRAAFVQARHGKLKMTVSVLTDNAGRYAVENLPAGEYRLSVRALGAKAEPEERHRARRRRHRGARLRAAERRRCAGAISPSCRACSSCRRRAASRPCSTIA